MTTYYGQIRQRHYLVSRNTPDASNISTVADLRPDLQSVLNDFQERYGRITTMNEFLHAEYNGLSDDQIKDLIGLPWPECRMSPEHSCWYHKDRGCQCLSVYQASGRLPLPDKNLDEGMTPERRQQLFDARWPSRTEIPL